MSSLKNMKNIELNVRYIFKFLFEGFLINLDKLIYLIVIAVPVYVLTNGKTYYLFINDIGLSLIALVLLGLIYSLVTWVIKRDFVCGRGCYYSHLLTYQSLILELICGAIFSILVGFISCCFSSYLKHLLIILLVSTTITIAVGTIFSNSRYRQELLLKEYIIDTYNYVTFIYVYLVVGFVMFYIFSVNIFEIDFHYKFLNELINKSGSNFSLGYLYTVLLYIVYPTILWILLSYNVLLNIKWDENKEERIFRMNNAFVLLVGSMFIIATLNLGFLLFMKLVKLGPYIGMALMIVITSMVFGLWNSSRDYPSSLVDSFFLGIVYTLPMILQYVTMIIWILETKYMFEVIFLLGLRLIALYILVVLIVNTAVFSSKRNFPIYEIYRMISRPLFIIMIFALVTPLAITIYFDNSVNAYILSEKNMLDNPGLVFVRTSLAYSSVISSVNMLLAEIYYTDKHLEERLNNYLRRFIDKLVSTMPPPDILRFIVVGYGEMGKRLVSGLFQHEIVSIKDPKVAEVMLISDKTTGAPRLVKYARCVKNVILIDKEYSEWYRTISHPVVGTVGVELVEYGYDERIYVPIIVNDITNDNVLNYIKLVGEWSSSPIKSMPKTMLFLAISDLNSLIRFLSKLSKSVTWQNIVVFYRILSSQQMTYISREVLEGRINGIYLDYIMGYNMGIPFIEFIKPFTVQKKLNPDVIYLGVKQWETE